MATIDTRLVVTRADGTTQITLPYPQEYTPDIYDVDAATTGRTAAGTMVRDREGRKNKLKWAALTHDDLTLLLQATQDSAFWLTALDIFTGTRKTFKVYVGDRSAPVYWYPSYNTDTWMYASLSMNFIEL